MLLRAITIMSLMSLAVSPMPAEAQAQRSKTSMCVFQGGESRLISSIAPLRSWERCARLIPVIAEGLTTTKLTFARSAGYDPQTGSFSNSIAGSTTEFIRPGEHLVVLDARLNGRQLSYSLSTNSYRFVNVLGIGDKLVSPSEFERLKTANGAEQLFMTVEASRFFPTEELAGDAEIGSGRIFAWRGNTFDDNGDENVFVECVAPTGCAGRMGWIAATSLSEMALVPRPTSVFPQTHQYLSLDLIKSCNQATQFVTATELKTAIGAKVPFAHLVGGELSASIEAVLKATREYSYGADVQVERVIFTVFKFREPSWWERKRWYPYRVRVLIVDRVTFGCNGDSPREYFELRTNNGSIRVTEPQVNSDITSSVVYTAFVARAQARSRGTVQDWAFNHIASALSALRR